MKQFIVIISMLSVLLLAACGGKITSSEEQNNNTNTSEDVNANTSTEKEPTLSETINTKEEQVLTYQLHNETIKETATLTNSDNQGYSMYVLPSFTLTGEEPRKDSLFLTDADYISMRIELLGDNPDWEQYEQNIPIELEYFNTDITNPTDHSLQMDNASIYEASNGEETVTIYLVKNENQPMKLTIFTRADEDYRSAFVEMAKTIQVNQ
ncbi:MAG: hypothetical protein ACI35P_09725 [Bacillus sp. (in: firmicutes)]